MKVHPLLSLPLILLSAPCWGGESDYWAYQAVKENNPPAIEDVFVRNPIDAFILSGLQENGIKPNERAHESELRRRLSYDVTGLPPRESTLEWAEQVDQYLASPQFGEKFASHWLDLVRYAETNGFERDSEKPEIWRYRDYVIHSLNEDKPYNRFVLEQLAGDLLPDKTLDSCLATGFLTLMQRDDEAADEPQAHADVISNMVDVTSEAFMGATLGCAKCHDHKVDPITQADYFSMRSFFAGVKKDFFKAANQTWVDTEVTRKREAERQGNLQAIAGQWAQIDRGLLDSYLKKSATPRAIELKSQSRVGVPDDPGWSLPSFDAKAGGFKDSVGWARNKPMALRSEFGLQDIPKQFLVYLQGSLVELQIFLNGVPVHSGVVDQVGGRYFIPLPVSDLTTGKNVLGIIAKVRRGAVKVSVTREPIHELTADQLAGMHPAVISRVYGEGFSSKMASLQQQRKLLEKPISGIRYHGVHEKSSINSPKIHRRGSVHALGDEVPIAFPAVMDPKSAQPKRTRLELAQWIASPSHPTTARVWVNRLWQYCFGHGLVETANDFGKLGTGVSNQALLDWLAAELVRSGWSTKHILRLMLNSSTYQMSSRGMNNKDSTNKLHWKYSSRRLTAEEVWDTYLVLTKQMKLELGGPPVRPKMPAAVLATSSRPSNAWKPSPGDAANRRAIYIHVKRSIKLPLLANFDSPERDFSCPSRFATIVPTQALTMLNSERMNEFADHFASRLQGTLEEKTKEAFRLATSREIGAGELHEILNLAKELRATHGVSEAELMPRICLLILNLNETLYLD